MQQFAGFFEFMSRFSSKGVMPANEAYVRLRAPSRFRTKRCPVSEKLIQNARDMLYEFKARNGVGLLTNTFYTHYGERGLSSDARGASDDKVGGWGVCAAGICARGAWKPLIWDALKNNRISINPLELHTAAALIEVAAKAKVLNPGARVIWRNDNASAICDWNKKRKGSAAMFEALRIVDEVATKHDITISGTAEVEVVLAATARSGFTQ